VLDILASQWVPDVLSVMAWYGLYTWLPLEWGGTSVAAELSYLAAGVAIALGCYAVSACLQTYDLGVKGMLAFALHCIALHCIALS
jgi:hypothetical protein